MSPLPGIFQPPYNPQLTPMRRAARMARVMIVKSRRSSRAEVAALNVPAAVGRS